MKSDATAVLQLMTTRGVGPRTLDRVFGALATEGLDLTDLLREPPQHWERFGLKPTLAEAIFRAAPEAERLRDYLGQQDISILIKGTASYPVRLREAKEFGPPVLFVRGNRTLLDRSAVAFCGSRNASERGLRLTEVVASALARQRVNVVSGYANGVDLAAHRASLRAGGETTIVLAEGILRFQPKPEVADCLDEERYLLLSEFAPRQAWSVGNAMQRNGTILALADVVLVVEAGMTGGTFAAAELAMKEGRPLFVVDFDSPPPSADGNQHFLARGAKRVPAPATGEPDLTDLLRLLSERALPRPAPSEETTAQPVQRSLFDGIEQE
jgi:DNA protecting protein DprA